MRRRAADDFLGFFRKGLFWGPTALGVVIPVCTLDVASLIRNSYQYKYKDSTFHIYICMFLYLSLNTYVYTS